MQLWVISPSPSQSWPVNFLSRSKESMTTIGGRESVSFIAASMRSSAAGEQLETRSTTSQLGVLLLIAEASSTDANTVTSLVNMTSLMIFSANASRSPSFWTPALSDCALASVQNSLKEGSATSCGSARVDSQAIIHRKRAPTPCE